MTTQDEAVIEAVARDLCIQDGFDPDGLIAYVKAPGTQAHAIAVADWNRYLDRARKSIRAYLSALDKAGWVVTQAEATDHMAVVAMNAWADLERMKDQRERMRHAVSQGIAASPPPPGADK